MKITLDQFGELNCNRPKLSTCFDIVSSWTENQNRANMGRLCAIAICLCADSPKFPTTRTLQDIYSYGSKCLDFLLESGVPVDQILESGVQCIGIMAAALPSTAEVEEVENFTEPQNPENSSG